ncbi:hypothetical protein CcaverHIS641_0506610 [Cutaneotrichosporon cavernicola]|nr:hypothetical protein CcaverHIS641_0506610 [Cutaneotrichosporon cavernicola]
MPHGLSTAKYTESSVWTQGDFEVITSDSVRYLIPSYHLFGARYCNLYRELTNASKLFRDAQTFESPPSWPFKYSVTLPDAEIETSAIFDLFLDLIVNIPLQGLLSPTKALTFPDWLCINNLIKFLHKWEVSQPYCKVLRHNINQELANSDTALQYFTIGAIANDADICRAVLQHHSDNKLAAFNPYRFQYFMWKACPAPYLGALTRAWSEAQSNQSYNFISRFNLHLTDNTFSEAQLRWVG